ncbi:MAG: LacI family DNA-binding transcriptional regulator [Akkermansiaceae bacterium]|jgi:DNA-binding LacI/PurR family transcriptional regulator
MGEVNQQVIADQLGLSRATVSRCFTNHPGINAVTRAKVFQLAAELGYVHTENRSKASRKKPGQQLRFTVLIASDSEEYFHGDYLSPGEQILAGVTEFAQSNDIKVNVDLVPPETTDISDPAIANLKSLKKRKSRGVLLIYPFSKSIVDQLALKFPLVSLVEQEEERSLDCVDVDHFSGISMAIDHLRELGHRNIGFYTREYPVAASWSFRRYSAFLDKMARDRVRVRQQDLLGVFPRTFPSVEASIEAAADRTRNHGVTAWVCAADHQAYDLIDGFKKLGLKVPKDVSVTGYDGIANPGRKDSLTTIEIPFRAIGMTGAERLANRVRKRFGGRQHVSITGKLITGTSTGPA